MTATLPPVATAAQKFAQELKKGVSTLRKPRTILLRDAPPSGNTVILFGPSGVGKTEFLIQLMCGSAAVPPVKALYVSADIGSGRTDMIKASLKNRGHIDKLDNMMILAVDDYLDFTSWVADPWSPEILAFDPDVMFFEGFGFWQGNDMVDYILEASVDDAGGKAGVSELRKEGLVFEKVGKDPAWEARKRATVAAVDDFCKIRHPAAKPLHKILTMFEGSKQEPIDANNPTAGSRQVLNGKPLLSGYATFDQIKGAADLLLKLEVKNNNGKREFVYVLGPSPKNVEGKVSGGIVLGSKDNEFEIPADACAVWAKLLEAVKV